MRGTRKPSLMGPGWQLATDGRTAIEGFRRMPSAEAQRTLRHAVYGQKLGGAIYQIWRAHYGGTPSVTVNAADHERALRWALQALEAGDQLVMHRRVLPPAGHFEYPAPPAPRVPPEPPIDESHWIQVDVLDQRDEVIASAPYSLALGEKIVSTGKFDRFGSVYLDRIKPGSYKVTLANPEITATQGDWLVIELVDTEGVPMAGERYQVTDAASKSFEGKTGSDGRALLQGVVGPCQVSFPELMELSQQE